MHLCHSSHSLGPHAREHNPTAMVGEDPGLSLHLQRQPRPRRCNSTGATMSFA